MSFHWIKAAAAAVAFGALVPATAVAQDFPTRQPIQLVVGFPPGGPTDIIGRVFGEALSRELGQTVLIINKGGAGGTLAAAFVAKQKADG
jgi:tripartite-type tricarboxylate transporter receptor subunit TctC